MAAVTKLHVNGASRKLNADAERTLLSVLRDDLNFTGAKYGCGEGECGACTVLIDGAPVRSCQRRVGSIGDKKVVTIEGLATGDQLHPVQQAFLNDDALQCGYCTSGMIMAAVALLRRKPEPTQPEIIAGMDGNICRCGVYTRIVAAVQTAAKEMKGKAV